MLYGYDPGMLCLKTVQKGAGLVSLGEVLQVLYFVLICVEQCCTAKFIYLQAAPNVAYAGISVQLGLRWAICMTAIALLHLRRWWALPVLTARWPRRPGPCNIHICVYAITSDLVSQPKNQALEENQWITDLAVNNVLDNLVGDDGDDWGVGQTGWWLVNPCLVRWGFRW